MLIFKHKRCFFFNFKVTLISSVFIKTKYIIKNELILHLQSVLK